MEMEYFSSKKYILYSLLKKIIQNVKNDKKENIPFIQRRGVLKLSLIRHVEYFIIKNEIYHIGQSYLKKMWTL